MSKPLHPTIKRYLAMAYQNGLRDLNRLSQRAIPKSNTKLLISDTAVKKETFVINEYVTCDIFSPINQNAISPAIIYFPASGYVFNRYEDSGLFCQHMALSLGYNIILPKFELAPKRQFMALLSDAMSCCEWLVSNNNKLNIETNRIYGWGESSGAHMLACLCHYMKENKKKVIHSQVLFYPAVDFANDYPSKRAYKNGYLLDGDFLNHLTSKIFEKHIKMDDSAISPLLHNEFNDLPNTIIITAEYDPLRDEAKQYAEKLKSANVSVVYKQFDGMIHGFLRFINKIDEANAAIAFACEHLQKSSSDEKTEFLIRG